MQNWSWNFDLASSPPPATRVEEDRYLAAPARFYPLDKDKVLLVRTQPERRIVVTRDVLRILDLCTEFRTLAGHREWILVNTPALDGKPDELTGVLRHLLRHGFFISAKDWVAGLAVPAVVPATGLVEALVIRTCDRPQALKRLLGDLLQAEHRNHWNGCRLIVVDDSRREEHLQENGRLISAARQQGGLRLEHHDREIQSSWWTALRRELPETASAIDFVSRCPEQPWPTPARPLVYALLIAAGRRFVLMDDDIRYGALAPPVTISATSELSVRSRTVRFFGRQGALGRASAVSMDPLLAHSGLLGLTLAQAQIAAANPLSVQGVSVLAGVNLDRLGPESRVLLTSSGTYGDPGTVNNDWIYGLDEAGRASLTSSTEDFAANLESRDLWLGRQSLHFSPRFVLMTTVPTGIDNRVLLPPPLPLFRNEDYLFGEMVQFLHPGSLLSEFPWAVRHAPVETREWPTLQPERLGVKGVARYIADFIAQQTGLCHGREAGSRLEFAAHLLFSLANMSHDELRAQVEDSRLQVLSGEILSLQSLLERETAAPDYWRRTIEQRLQLNQQSLAKPSPALFFELAALGDAVAQGQEFLRIVHSYAELCRDWSQMVRTAGSLIASTRGH